MATVQSGENLSVIARRYGLDVRDLIAANPQLANPNLIRPGQEIKIPGGPASQTERQAAGNLMMATSPTAAAPVSAQAPAASNRAPAVVSTVAVAPQVTGINAPFELERRQDRSGRALGQAFPRAQATLAPQGAVATGAAAMRRPNAPAAVITPTGTAPNVAGLFAPPPLPAATGTVSPRAGFGEVGLTPEFVIPKATVQQLSYLDQLALTDPSRASEVARFQSATIGRAVPEAALATNVFFTERAISNGTLPRNASENVWDVIAARMGTGLTGAQLLEQRGYVPIGGGIWYLGGLGTGSGVSMGSASARDLSPSFGGGSPGGFGGTGGGFGDSARFFGGASIGLINWRV